MSDEQISLERLPIDCTSFSDIRNSNQIYVDKTALIAEFAKLKATYFLARPRRFGKSLLINTLADLFSNGLLNFKGLDIENTWHDRTYKVIRIDFSNYKDKTIEEIIVNLTDELLIQTGFIDQINRLDAKGNYYTPDFILKYIATKIEDRSYVLLIDEYDAPLTHLLDNKEQLDKVISILNNFYSTVKSCSSKFRLIFITGVTRIAHLSIFSAFNNLIELTLNNKYANLLGITDDELKKYFHPYVEYAAKILDMPISDVYAALKARYDGFKFSFTSNNTLYNPWSIINFFLNPQNGFKNYWFDSGGTPSILINYLKVKRNIDIWEYKNRELTITENELYAKSEVLNIPLKLLLTQAGYFTLTDCSKSSAKLIFTNSEIEESMLRLYLTANNITMKYETTKFVDNLCEYIDAHDIDNIIKVFNLITNDCVSPKSKFFKDEYTLRDLFYANIPNSSTLFKQKEREYTLGRSDLELITTKTRLVIEFKLTRTNRSARAALKEGIAQIKSRRYGETAFSRQTLFKIVLVASHKEKRILPNYSVIVD